MYQDGVNGRRPPLHEVHIESEVAEEWHLPSVHSMAGVHLPHRGTFGGVEDAALQGQEENSCPPTGETSEHTRRD